MSYDTKSTIDRIMLTFDIIKSNSREWTEGEILQRLRDAGFSVSQSQLNRDLRRYHERFEVERSEVDSMGYQKPVYKSLKAIRKMTENEIQFLTLLETIKAHVSKHLPTDSEIYLDTVLGVMVNQRSHLQRYNPTHQIFGLQKNLQVLVDCEDSGSIDQAFIAEFRYALIKHKDVVLISSEYGTSEQDTFRPIKVYEQGGEFFVTGMSALEGGTNRTYCFSNLLAVQSAENEAQHQIVPLSASRR